MEICAPAGNLASLVAAFDAGADAVYMSFSGSTNLRNFPGLNFTEAELKKGMTIALKKGGKVYLAVNSLPQSGEIDGCISCIDAGVRLGVNAIIVSDFGLLSYIKDKYPDMRTHLSVQAHISNYEALSLLKREFGIKRVVLPRILSLDMVGELKKNTDLELEIFGLGLLCINCEGLCFMSSYLTGESINTHGACSGPGFVRFDYGEHEFSVSSGGVVLNKYKEGESAAYPTPCKGRYEVNGKLHRLFQEPASLNLVDIIDEVLKIGVDAIKIEGRQRTKAYTAKVTAAFREAIDNPGTFLSGRKLDIFFEGMQTTCGCYKMEDR